MTDTIFALSSGALPAAVAVVRISGPDAWCAASALCDGKLPPPRRAALRALRWRDAPLDQALVLAFRAPASATGDDVVELQLHGGRATVAAVLDALGAQPGLRTAEPGEFTRRALENGKLDLTQVEGLVDLLAAETEQQRRAALRLADGGFSAQVERWRGELVSASARVEAAIDFADEDDVEPWPAADRARCLTALGAAMADALASPPAERLRDGARVVLGGPPNAGKSTLLNALVGREAAITSPIAGTTRDVIEAPVDLAGWPVIFVDTAGLRNAATDSVESLGIARAHSEAQRADVLLWLGMERPPVTDAPVIRVRSKSDLDGQPLEGALAVSAKTEAGLDELRAAICRILAAMLPVDRLALNQRQRGIISETRGDIDAAACSDDLLIVAEHLRRARVAFDRLTGRAGVEPMLDDLFGRFCIGK